MVGRKIFVVVINWNGKDLTVRCIKSLKDEIGNDRNISVVLVDNASTDGSIEFFDKFKPQFKFNFIKNKKNLGWTGANNVGIKYALKNSAACVMLLANDGVIRKGAIKNLTEKLFSKSSIGIVGPKIYKYNSKPPIIANAGNFFKENMLSFDLGDGEKDLGQYQNIDETDFVAGTAITIKKEVFKKIGFFDDEFFIYFEDVDFCMRAKKAGFSCHFVPDAVVYHVGAATTHVGSPLHTYYNTRNRLIVLTRYGLLREKLKEIPIILKRIVKYVIKKRKGERYTVYAVFDFIFKRLGERKYW